MKTLAPSVRTAVQRQIDMLLEGDAEIITVEELEQKLSEAGLPKEAKKKAERKVKKHQKQIIKVRP